MVIQTLIKVLIMQHSIVKFFIGNVNSGASPIKLQSEIAIPNSIQPFTSMDKTTRILDDEYHPLHTDNKVVLDMNPSPTNQNQVKIDLDWLFEVENVELDGYVLIDNPVFHSKNNEMLVLASLKVDKLDNNQYVITIYDVNGVLVECSFAIDC